MSRQSLFVISAMAFIMCVMLLSVASADEAPNMNLKVQDDAADATADAGEVPQINAVVDPIAGRIFSRVAAGLRAARASAAAFGTPIKVNVDYDAVHQSIIAAHK